MRHIKCELRRDIRNSYETINATTATERMTLKVKFDVLLNIAIPLITQKVR